LRFLSLAIRNAKETYRDPLALGFLIAFPLLFMLLFGAALGGNSDFSFTIGVVDEDDTEISGQFINQVLADIPVFKITVFGSTSQVTEDLKNGNIESALIVPAGFGEEIKKNWQNQDSDIILELVYDESDLTFSSQLISTVNTAVKDFARVNIPITIHTNHINIGSKVSQIDYVAPGIIIFGLLIMIPTSARIMVTDKESGFMGRLLATPTYPWEFIAGYSVSMLIIAIIQIIIFILLGMAFGMNIVGNIALAFLIFFLTAICSISIGMIVAALSRSSSQTEALCWLISMPLAILSGVWFSRDVMPGYIQLLGDLFPYSHAVSAARIIIIRGAGFSAVSGSILILTAWAFIAFTVGIILFRYKMKA
jgi:ABC-2 type transport system permease protein